MDIQVWSEENSKGFQLGDFIAIQEKIDSANFSIRFNPERHCCILR